MRTKTGITNYGPTLAEAKLYLRLDASDEDTLVSALITASYDQVTAECNRDFTPCTQSFNVFSSSGDLYLSSQTVDVVSTGSIKESNGCWYTYMDTVYNGNINFTVGSGSTYPANVKVAQMMLINSFYENRLPEVIGNITSPVSFSVAALLSPYKLIKP